jgi:PPK2 family polyphosphate:nucleotide phosphotransferase
MNAKELLKKSHAFCTRYRVANGKKFHLKDIDPGDAQGLKSEIKKRSKEILQLGVETLAHLQEVLYANNKWSVLLIFQAMDSAGKDGAIKHVMSGVNPQGCEVHSFKSPTNEDLDHDYLWRCMKRLPSRGRIGIFNRSYYEELLAVRVHPEFLQKQKIPAKLVTKDIWKERFEDIANFERYLTRNGIIICKFFLHISKQEQKRRFLDRLNTPEKNWKFSPADLDERGYWDQYMKAYEEMIRHTATPYAPWYVVPANNKWFSRLVVAAAVVDTLAELKLSFPKVDRQKNAELVAAKKKLLSKA